MHESDIELKDKETDLPSVPEIAGQPVLVFRTLELRRFLGISQRYQQLSLPGNDGQKFASGVNILFGPNASGKTTTALALQALLWPQCRHAQNCSISGTFELDQSGWTIEVEAGRAFYRKAGRKTERPQQLIVGVKERRDCYRLALHELLRADDQELALQIQNEIYGGLDLSRAAADLQFNPKVPGTRQAECRALQSTRKLVKDAREAQRRLQDKKRELPQLEREVLAARQASERLTVLEKLQELREAETEYQLAKSSLAEFPATIKMLAGNEADEIDRLRNELEQKKEQHRRAEEELHEAEAQVGATGLEQPPTNEELEVLVSLTGSIQEKHNELNRLEREIDGFQAALEKARNRLGVDLTNEQLKTLELSGLEDLSEFIREVEEVRGQHIALQSIIAYLETATESQAEDDELKIQRGIDLLSQWLRTPQPSAKNGKIQKIAGIGLICTFVLILLLAALHSLLWLVTTVVPVVLSFFLLRERQTVSADQDISALYAEQNLEAPESWTVEAVRKILTELIDKLAIVRLEKEKANYVRARQNELQELVTKTDALELRRRELVDKLGLPSDMEEARLYLTAKNMTDWQSADSQLAELRKKAEACDKQIQDDLQMFNHHCSRFSGGRQAENRHEAEAMLKDLQNRADDYRQSKQKIMFQTNQVEAFDLEIQEREKRRKEILKKVRPDLDPHPSTAELNEAEDELRRLIAQVPAYRKAFSQSESERLTVKKADGKLRADPRFREQLLEFNDAEIENKRRNQQEEAETYEEKFEDLHRLRSEIAAAKKGHDLESALWAKANAERALDAVRQKVEKSNVGYLVLEHIRRRNQATASQVLSKAGELFQTITHHEFELRLDDNETAQFVAYDTRAGKERSLDELSSGTRVQLLLAVRMAFIEQLEGNGPRLPLLLDELLGNSDDERARAIIAAVAEIARRGRQIFYFTAQHDEVSKWREYLKKDAQLECQHFYLPTPGRKADRELLRKPTSAPDILVPQPVENDSYVDYGRALKVPALDPFMKNAEQLHMWYLLSDSQLLHSFVKHGYSWWGQVKKLVEYAGVEKLLHLGLCTDVLQFNKASVNAEVLLKIAQLWQLGRGAPVTKAVIYASESPVSSSTLVDLIADCADECQGNADILLTKLRDGAVPRLRTDLIERLTLYLEEQGCLSSQPVLPRDEIRIRLDAFAADWVAAGLIDHARLNELLDRFLAAADGEQDADDDQPHKKAVNREE